MTEQLHHIQQALKDIVLTYIEAQKVNTEPVYDARVYGAETSIRIIANKTVPYLMYDIMKQLHILDEIEFEQPEASVHYVIQIISSMTNFADIWNRCLTEYGAYLPVKVALQSLFDTAGDIKKQYQTIHR